MESITIEAIKQKYPNPVSLEMATYSENAHQQYCVGGAFCMYIGEGVHWPGPGILREALMKENPKLDLEMASYYTSRILALNDAGKFSEAWVFLGKALHHREGDEDNADP